MGIRVNFEQPMGNFKTIQAEIDGPSSYNTTTKFQITAKQLNLGRIHGFAITNSMVKATGAPGNLTAGYPNQADNFDQGFSQINVVFATTPVGGTEVTNATDLSTIQFKIIAWGDNGGAY